MDKLYANNNLSGSELPSECTTILVGKQQTTDGRQVCARSMDWDGLWCENLKIYHDTEHGRREFVANDSPFRCPLPEKRFGYSALEPFDQPEAWGSAGFNTQGVGMSATESIFSNEKALKVDPLVPGGLAENSIYNIVLPYISTAREGVKRLGDMIEVYGIAEGFGVGFIDNDEVWYLETACGHRWMACRLPQDKYFVTGNQSRFRDYKASDRSNFLASKDLVEFAKKNKLYNAKGDFDFHAAYSRDEKQDTTYNYPRVWGLQKMFTPSKKQNVKVNDYPIYLDADQSISMDDLRRAFRFHYDGTAHDPYLHDNPKEPYRPVSIFRTTQTHILTVRDWLPCEIGCVNYVALGMADLGVFLPFYLGIDHYPEAYGKGNRHASQDSAYWKFRKVMTLAMTNYNAYAPVVKETYLNLEHEMDERMIDFEDQYMQIVDTRPLQAKDLLQEFSDKMLTRALVVADELQEELFTRLTQDTQTKYLFHGA